MKNAGYIGYQLRELNASGAIASIFTDSENPDVFLAGYVRGINARSALVESITPYGRYDGWIGMRIASVIEVTHDAEYAERLELLLRIHGEKPSELFSGDDEDYIMVLLRYALEQHRVVTIWTASDVYAGYVQALDDLRVTVELLDFMGGQSDLCPVRLIDVELLSLGSEEERVNEALSEHTRRGKNE